jgi:hypothetical protein
VMIGAGTNRRTTRPDGRAASRTESGIPAPILARKAASFCRGGNRRKVSAITGGSIGPGPIGPEILIPAVNPFAWPANKWERHPPTDPAHYFPVGG